MSKPGKSLKALCKKLGVRLTVKRGKKRVYKSVKVLKGQCKRKAGKKKKKVKRRRRKFGSGPEFWTQRGSANAPDPFEELYGDKQDSHTLHSPGWSPTVPSIPSISLPASGLNLSPRGRRPSRRLQRIHRNMGNTSRTLFQFGKKSKKKSVDIISFAKKNKIPLGIAAAILSSVGLGYYIKNRKPSEEQLFKDFPNGWVYGLMKKYPNLSPKDIKEIELLWEIVAKYNRLYGMYIDEVSNFKKQPEVQKLKKKIDKKGYNETSDETTGHIVLYKLRKLIRKAVILLDQPDNDVLIRGLNEIKDLEQELEGVKKMSLKEVREWYMFN